MTSGMSRGLTTAPQSPRPTCAHTCMHAHRHTHIDSPRANQSQLLPKEAQSLELRGNLEACKKLSSLSKKRPLRLTHPVPKVT